MEWILLLAEGEAAPGGQPAAQPGGGLMGTMILFGLMFLVMYVFMILPMRRQRRDQMNMLAALKKNDKVVTQAGILGVVVAIKENEDEVTLKVDDSTNSRMRVLKSSIARILPSGEEAKETSVQAKTG
jgi:preprotein translocase subunit YajC